MPGADKRFFSDAWDGYVAARRRLLQSVRAARVANPVVLGGDVHSFWVNDLVDAEGGDAMPLASEFVTTSISSLPPPEDVIANAARESPQVRFATGLHRGYMTLDLDLERITATLRAVDDATRADSACRSLSTWVVDAGRPGARPV